MLLASTSLALIKFQIVIPVILLLAVRRGWKLLVGFSVAGTVLMLQFGRAILKGFVGAVLYATHAAEGAPWSMPNLRGIVYGLTGADHFAVTVALSLASWEIAVYFVRRSDHYFAVAILALLVSYHLHLHDLTLLLIPLAAARKHIVAACYIAPPAFLFTNPHLLWFMGFLLLAPLADGSTPAPYLLRRCWRRQRQGQRGGCSP